MAYSKNVSKNQSPAIKKDPSPSHKAPPATPAKPSSHSATHVVLSIPDGTQIRIPKETIMKSSDVLKAMLESNTWKEGRDNNIAIKAIPNVPIRPADFLNFFGRMLQHETTIQEWPCSNFMQIYGWANYYQVAVIMKESLASIVKFHGNNQNLTQHNLTIYLKFLNNFNLEEIKNELSKRTLPIKKENCLEFFTFCKEYQMKQFMDQVVSFMAKNVDPDDKWPSDLMILVLKKLKETNAEVNKKNDDLNKKHEAEIQALTKKRKRNSD